MRRRTNFKFSSMTQLATWGPLFWRVLHTIAEQVGKNKPPFMQADEVSRWIVFMKTVGGSLPCAVCREHYQAALKKYPLADLATLRGPAFRTAAKRWVWGIHQDVNGRKNVVGITYEDLEEKYKYTSDFSATVEALIKELKEGVSAGQVRADLTWDFRRQLLYIRKLTDSV